MLAWSPGGDAVFVGCDSVWPAGHIVLIITSASSATPAGPLASRRRRGIGGVTCLIGATAVKPWGSTCAGSCCRRGLCTYLGVWVGLMLCPSRMLKKASSCVLASLGGSTYRKGHAFASSLAAALLESLFEHPARHSVEVAVLGILRPPRVWKGFFNTLLGSQSLQACPDRSLVQLGSSLLTAGEQRDTQTPTLKT